MAGAAGALVVACLLWWTYFGWFNEALEERLGAAAPRDIGRAVRDAYSLGHFPMLVGIIGFAVVLEELVHHPSDPLPTAVMAALGIGIALFVGFSAFPYRRLGGPLLVRRLLATAGMVVGLVVVGSLAPIWPLVVEAVALLALNLAELPMRRSGEVP